MAMLVEVRIPSPGESVTEVSIGNWLVEDNEYVTKDQEIAEVETDKATLPLVAPESGMLKIITAAGIKAKPGDVACTLDTSVKKDGIKQPDVQKTDIKHIEKTIEDTKSNTVEKQPPELNGEVTVKQAGSDSSSEALPGVKVTPVARRMMEEHHLDIDDIINGLKKITGHHIEKVVELSSVKTGTSGKTSERRTESVPMSAFRRKLANRLVAVKNETAMLTTFNEIDMWAVMDLRRRYQKDFQEKHGIKLGIMSFFIKAASLALENYPRVNAMIDGDKIVYQHFADISVAVQTEKGLMVPVIRNANTLSLGEIEKEIATLADKARNNKLSVEEMTGGTFTITNGGVFGSMLSTPLINPPQSAILGMHNIVDRAVVREGRIEARPIMYVALSYDHRIIDGKDSVSFLSHIRKLIENPVLMTGKDRELELLQL